MSKRIFLGVKVVPDAPLLQLYRELRVGLHNETIKWVEPHLWHLTLHFLGDTEEKQISALAGAVEEQITGFGTCRFQIGAPGYFADRQQIKVIWLGISDTDSLAALHKLTASALSNLGIAVDLRPFRPHLTLARVKHMHQKSHFLTLLKRYDDELVKEVEVAEIILFESVLRPAGPDYQPLHVFRL